MDKRGGVKLFPGENPKGSGPPGGQAGRQAGRQLVLVFIADSIKPIYFHDEWPNDYVNLLFTKYGLVEKNQRRYCILRTADMSVLY